MADLYLEVLIRAGLDFTTRWSCRKGDYVLWLRRDPFKGPSDEPQVIDLWSMPDGAFVTITNRWQDLPPWFDLHPLEVKDTLVKWMMTRVDAGDYPEEPIDGPNIWRAKGGDRIVWVGPLRSGQAHVDSILGILDCRAAVAVLADHPNRPLAFMEFVQTPEALALCRDAMEAERGLGEARVFENEWKLG